LNGNGHAQRLRFPLVAFADIALDTKRRYLVKNLIPRDGLIVFWGPPKCGKSFLVSDIAFHIALGWDYRGRRVEQGTVVYVACEGQTGFKARVEAFKQARLSEETPTPPFHLLATRLDLAADADELIHDIAAQLGAVECSCIVLDTLNRSLGGSESKDEDMSAYIQACDKVRETFHCSVIVIHHCGIEGTRPRGHTSLSGAADAQIAVKRDDVKNIIATIEYMKDGPDEAELVSRLETVDVGFDEDNEAITSCVIEALDVAPVRAAKSKSPKLAAGAKVAINSLHTAIERNGTPAPASNYIPPGKVVSTLDMWRRFHYQALGSDMAADAKRQDFYRARSQLQAAAQIGIHGDYVWVV
jgi:hypothetical protein